MVSEVPYRITKILYGVLWYPTELLRFCMVSEVPYRITKILYGVLWFPTELLRFCMVSEVPGILWNTASHEVQVGETMLEKGTGLISLPTTQYTLQHYSNSNTNKFNFTCLIKRKKKFRNTDMKCIQFFLAKPKWEDMTLGGEEEEGGEKKCKWKFLRSYTYHSRMQLSFTIL